MFSVAVPPLIDRVALPFSLPRGLIVSTTYAGGLPPTPAGDTVIDTWNFVVSRLAPNKETQVGLALHVPEVVPEAEPRTIAIRVHQGRHLGLIRHLLVVAAGLDAERDAVALRDWQQVVERGARAVEVELRGLGPSRDKVEFGRGVFARVDVARVNQRLQLVRVILQGHAAEVDDDARRPDTCRGFNGLFRQIKRAVAIGLPDAR